MSRKSRRKIILIAQCLVNPYCRVHLLGQNFDLSHELMDYLMHERVGIVQYPCPETTAMGLMRNPQGRQQYDNIFFREHCKELLKIPMLMVREFIENKYRLTCFIGLENSPTCGIHWGRHKVNRYMTESPNPVDTPGPDDPVLMGIMAEILSEELAEDDIRVPFLEFPTKETPESPKRKQFWKDLKRAVEPEMYAHEVKGEGGETQV
jgi:predicted secreted protein